MVGFTGRVTGGASPGQAGSAIQALMRGALEGSMAELNAKMMGNQLNVEAFRGSLESGAFRQNELRQRKQLNRQVQQATSQQ